MKFLSKSYPATMSGLRTLLGSFFLLSLFSATQSLTIKFSTYEEDAVGTVIGTLARDVDAGLGEKTNSSFRLMKPLNASVIRVREVDGQLTVAKRIDREQICKRSHQCTMTFDVVSFGTDQFKLFHVEVEVKDINDNSPVFSSSELSLEMSENAVLGTRVSLDVAVDEDVGANSIQSFRLSVNSHFIIDEMQNRGDGSKYVELVLVQELDREKQDFYELELTAIDGGNPPLSGTLTINIKVSDINDNSPVFSQSVFSVEVNEDVPVGFLLLELSATDEDEGENGKIIYGFSGQVSSEYLQLFKIDPVSGHLTVSGHLDYETRESYELDIQALDLGPNSVPGRCKVMVHLKDVNDNAPEVTITPMSSLSEEVVYVTEAAAQDSFVALISTLDRDSGDNGRVRCSLHGHSHIGLQQAYEDSYMVLTTAPLDREKNPEYNMTLVAEDLGSPSFKTIVQFTVRITDENDNAPLFSKSHYEVSVLENNMPGAYITTVVARDPDLGQNGKVTYELSEPELIWAGAPISSLVSLDPVTGNLCTKKSFDYEVLKKIEVSIRASDGGVPPLSSTALVTVNILDENDNAPVITRPFLRNGSADVVLPISAPLGYLLTKINARDIDEGSNSELSYHILADTFKGFSISKKSGEIVLARKIDTDYRPFESVNITVAVTDHGRPPLTTVAVISFILVEMAPSSVQIGVLEHSWKGTEIGWDWSVAVIILLSGGCVLLLIAIIVVSATRRERDRVDKVKTLEQSENRGLVSSGSGCSDSSRTPADSCNLSIITVSESMEDRDETSSEHSSDSPGKYGQDVLTTQKASSKGFEPLMSIHSATEFSGDKSCSLSITNSDPGSMKDSGKGESDSNDSDSDTSRNESRDYTVNCKPAETEHLSTMASRLSRSKEIRIRYPVQCPEAGQFYTLQCETRYVTARPSVPAYHQLTAFPRIHQQHQIKREPYFQTSIPCMKEVKHAQQLALLHANGKRTFSENSSYERTDVSFPKDKAPQLPETGSKFELATSL